VVAGTRGEVAALDSLLSVGVGSANLSVASMTIEGAALASVLSVGVG
jgi:hypothetical protein